MRSAARSTVVAILLSCFAMPALAKVPGHVGVRGGVNLAAFGGEFAELVDFKNRVAPNIALVYDYPVSPNLSFRGEVGYSGKGAESESESVDQSGNLTTFKTEWRFEYIEIPLLVRGRFGSVGKATPFFELGPTLGFALSGKAEDNLGILGEVDLKDDMKPVDVGWGAGAGLEFAAGPGRIGVEARYTRGFSDLFDVDGNAAAINQAWTFALSYTR